MNTLVIARTMEEGIDFSRDMPGAWVRSTSQLEVPNGLWPDRIVWVHGWWLGPLAGPVEKWALILSHKRHVEHVGNGHISKQALFTERYGTR